MFTCEDRHTRVQYKLQAVYEREPTGEHEFGIRRLESRNLQEGQLKAGGTNTPEHDGRVRLDATDSDGIPPCDWRLDTKCWRR